MSSTRGPGLRAAVAQYGLRLDMASYCKDTEQLLPEQAGKVIQHDF